MSYEEDPSFEGYLQVKARLSGWGWGGGGGSWGQLMSYEEDPSFEGYGTAHELRGGPQL